MEGQQQICVDVATSADVGECTVNHVLPASHIEFLNLIFPSDLGQCTEPGINEHFAEKSHPPESLSDIQSCRCILSSQNDSGLSLSHLTCAESTSSVAVTKMVETQQPVFIVAIDKDDAKTVQSLANRCDSLLNSNKLLDLAASELTCLSRTSELTSDYVRNNRKEIKTNTFTSSALQSVPSAHENFVETDDDDDSANTKKHAVKKKRTTKLLKFPPCFICSGNASGSHYGVNSCEACKGFFRRYLKRKEDYECRKGGNCEVIDRNRGNCSGCRLKKCLDFGMSKDKCKLGRYTLSRRTETIKKVNKLEGKAETDSMAEGKELELLQECVTAVCVDFDPDSELISRKMKDGCGFVASEVFSENLVEELVKAMDDIQPYGPHITTKEQIQESLHKHYEYYQLKVRLYGEMKPVSKEDYYKLYNDFGIDIDGRMDSFRDCTKDFESLIERYCNFAKHIPLFVKLPYIDQSNLLKASRCDFFIIVMHHCYRHEYQTFLSNTGSAYHIDEAADKFFSRKLITTLCDMYARWQTLCLSKAEQALLGALTIVFTDRCKIENHHLVEKIQLSLMELLQNELEKSDKLTCKKRFAKIINYLILMRDGSELYLQEYKQLCKDKVLVDEVPMMTEFLMEDSG